MTREPIEVTRQDRIYCLKVSSDYHSEVCEECKFYPNCDHMTQDDMTELTIKDLEALEQEPISETDIILTREEYGELVSSEYDNGYAKGYEEALEQESVLDKIIAEIEACREDVEPHLVDYRYYRNEGLDMALDIIDKYN